MRVLLLGGTSDGRTLASQLAEAGVQVELHTLTEYGRSLSVDPRVEAISGALDASALAQRLAQCDVLVDATHPHAFQISEMAMRVAVEQERKFLRFERASTESDRVIVAATHADAARAAARIVPPGGVAFLTIGSRHLAEYVAVPLAEGARWVARVLPDAQSLQACVDAGLTPRDIVALQGPTSEHLDRAFLRHLSACVLVTKESGAAGGTPEKIAAAHAEGIPAIVVGRPVLNYPWKTSSLKAMVTRVLELGNLLQGEVEEESQRKSYWHIYCGDGKGKSTAAIGLATRALGTGRSVCFIQFLKGGAESGELVALRKLGAHVERPARFPTGILRGQITQEDRAAARETMQLACRELASGKWDLVILDELHGAVRHGLVSSEEALAAIEKRSESTEVVTTGRGPLEEWCARADLVTEMLCRKHYFAQGVTARPGIEF